MHVEGDQRDRRLSQILHDAEGNAGNTFDNPNRVIPRQLAIRADGSQIVLDPPRLSAATAVAPIH